MTINSIFFDIAGWIGMVLVLVAYLMLSFGKIKNGYTYQIINLVAGIFMAIGLLPKNAWFSFTLEVAWSAIAIISIVKLSREPRRRKK